MTGAATFTNLAWPEDPYRTGQQLFRKPGPMLTAVALTTDALTGTSPAAPTAMAVAYLPLNRTRPAAIAGQELDFGFRAVSASDPAGLADLARQVDLDLARARRHASVLAGLLVAEQIDRLQADVGEMVLRGAAAIRRDWADRASPARGKALMIDCGLDLPARSLGQACGHAQISAGPGWEQAATGDQAETELAAAQATGTALTVALLAGKHLGRLTWNQDLDITGILTTSVWDRFPRLRARAATASKGTAAHPVTPSHKWRE